MIDTGYFVTIEGIDGAGKTVNLQWLHSYLIQAGKKVLCTREPGGTVLGEQIRDLFLHQRTLNIEPVSELLLLAAARAEHVAKVIRPALARGEWVLCDRFSDATYAYQGGGRGIDIGVLRWMELITHNELQPDLTLLLDVSIELSRARIEQRMMLNRFDQETLAFSQRVRNAYLERAAAEPQRFCVIDAAGEIHEVQQKIANCVSRLFKSPLAKPIALMSQ